LGLLFIAFGGNKSIPLQRIFTGVQKFRLTHSSHVLQHPHFTIDKKGLLWKPSGENLLQIIHLSASSTLLVSLMGGGAAFLLLLDGPGIWATFEV